MLIIATSTGAAWCAQSASDPPGRIDPQNAQLKKGAFWDGYWTRSAAKLTTDAEGHGVQRERNATFRSLAAVAGVKAPDAFLTKGYLHFRIKINAAGLVAVGGGKHLINLNSSPGPLGRRDRRGTSTRVEIANPGGRGDDPRPRLILHNYRRVDGKRQGGATVMGRLPFRFAPEVWVEVDWTWRLDGRTLRMEVNGKKYEVQLLEGSEGPGRYWGPGHMETKAGGGVFTFADVKVAKEPPRNVKTAPRNVGPTTLRVTEEKDRITVTSPGRFEVVFRDYHAGIADWYDLKNDPGRTRSMCSASDVKVPSPLHHALLWMKLAPADRDLGGPYHPAPALKTELLEKGPARVRIRQTGTHSQYGKGRKPLDRIDFERVWTITPVGAVYHRYDLINTGEPFGIRALNVVLHTSDLWRGTRTKVPGERRPVYDETKREVRVDADEAGHGTFEKRPQRTTLMRQWSDGPTYFADCLVVARVGRYGVAYWAVPGPYDYRTSLSVVDVFPDGTIPKGRTTLHFLMQLGDGINGVAPARERAEDYRTPATLTMTKGTFVDYDGQYVLTSEDGVAFRMESPKHRRFHPVFEIRNWPVGKQGHVTLDGNALTPGTDEVSQSADGVCVVQLLRVLPPGTVTLAITPVDSPPPAPPSSP